MTSARPAGRGRAPAARASAAESGVTRQPTRDSRPALRLVRPDERLPHGLHRRRVFVALFGLGIFTALFGVVAFHVVLNQGQVELDHLESRLSAEQSRYRELRLQTAQLESPGRIVADAQRLGMLPPTVLTYLSPDDLTAAPIVVSSQPPAPAKPASTTTASTMAGKTATGKATTPTTMIGRGTTATTVAGRTRTGTATATATTPTTAATRRTTATSPYAPAYSTYPQSSAGPRR